MNNESNFFDENGHLNDAGIVLWSDAMRLKRELELPEDMQEHLELCSQCRTNVFDYYEFKREDNIAELANHFYFDKKATSQESNHATDTPVRKIVADNQQTPAKTISLQRKLSVAASIVVLLVAGFWAIRSLDKPNNGHQHNISGNTTTDSAKKTPSIKDISENTNKGLAQNTPPTKDSAKEIKKENKEVKEVIQTPNPVFDDAIAFLDQKIARRTRGNNVNSPQQGTEYASGQAILFQWKNGQVADAFELRLFTKNTQGTPQIIKIKGDVGQYNLRQTLKNGKHYWRLFQVNQGRKQEVGLGSFTIK